MSARAVVFDRDGVLVRTRLRDLLRDLLQHVRMDEKELMRRWIGWLGGRALATSVEERHAARAFLDELSRDPELTPSARGAVAGFDHGSYVEAFPDAAPALDGVRARGLSVGLLTNNSAGLSATGPLAAVGLQDRVDVALSAQQIGAAKPERRAYLAICDALGVGPHECILFDDVPEWVEGARSAGLRAYLVDRSRRENDLPKGVLSSLSGISAVLEGGAE
jgi:putative hydrolase of the HAD superfamily